MAQYKEKKRHLHKMFINQAYDKVPREVLWRCLRAKGVFVHTLVQLRTCKMEPIPKDNEETRSI